MVINLIQRVGTVNGFGIWYASQPNDAGGNDYGWAATDSTGKIYQESWSYKRSDTETWAANYTPCVSNWVCEPGNTGYEVDGCGNKRSNPTCSITPPPPIPPPIPPPPAGCPTDPIGSFICGLLDFLHLPNPLKK